jgi:Raf kinase inhibitor-like YbhB/YbcL family protein
MRFLHFLAMAGAVALSGCAAMGSGPDPALSGTPLTLTSSSFADGGVLEKRHAGNLKENPNCVGDNVSPPLAWRNVPAGTKSLAFIVYDPDGRSGLGVVHWVAYGISPAVTGFAENEVARPSARYVGGKSSQNLPNYMGPCPPAATGWHHYNYTIIATDLEPDALPAGLTRDELFAKLAGRAKGSATMIGRYGR